MKSRKWDEGGEKGPKWERIAGKRRKTAGK